MPNHNIIPLVHNGDGYSIEVEEVSPKLLRLVTVLRYPDNHNTAPTAERFRDLTPDTKAAVIRQINRRFHGKTVKV